MQRRAVGAAMPSIPAKIPTLPARRARLAAVSSRSGTRRRSAPPAVGARENRSTSPTPAARAIRRGAPPAPNANGGLATAPPSQTPRDEFDLGIGYMERKDYALAEQTMRNFAQKYPGDPLLADSQYWLGESLFQRQQYRDAAEAFLAVTTKFDKSAKAPDALAAARTIAGGAEGKGSRLRRVRRGDAKISARLERRESGRGPRAKAGEVLKPVFPGSDRRIPLGLPRVPA